MREVAKIDPKYPSYAPPPPRLREVPGEKAAKPWEPTGVRRAWLWRPFGGHKGRESAKPWQHGTCKLLLLPPTGAIELSLMVFMPHGSQVPRPFPRRKKGRPSGRKRKRVLALNRSSLGPPRHASFADPSTQRLSAQNVRRPPPLTRVLLGTPQQVEVCRLGGRKGEGPGQVHWVAVVALRGRLRLQRQGRPRESMPWHAM